MVNPGEKLPMAVFGLVPRFVAASLIAYWTGEFANSFTLAKLKLLTLQLLAPLGRLVQIACSHGSQVTVDVRAIMMKRLVVTGSTLRSRPVEDKSALARAVEQQVWPLFTSGRIRPIIDRCYPLEQAAEAHRFMESGQHSGKIVLEVP